jgi:hypothetical protein
MVPPASSAMTLTTIPNVELEPVCLPAILRVVRGVVLDCGLLTEPGLVVSLPPEIVRLSVVSDPGAVELSSVSDPAELSTPLNASELLDVSDDPTVVSDPLLPPLPSEGVPPPCDEPPPVGGGGATGLLTVTVSLACALAPPEEVV